MVKEIKDLVQYATQTEIQNDEAQMIKRAFQGEFRAPFTNREGVGAVMAGVLANYNGIYFIGTNHTADYVELAAWGPGSDRLPAFVRNTALFDLMVDMAGIRDYAQG
jgi:alkaline phosphatase